MVNTLRRKMFKLGGSANTHGVGLTSGLSFNQGGSVKPGPDGKPRLHAKTGLLVDLLTGGASFVGRRGKKLYDDIIESIGPKTSRVTGKSGSTRELITDTGGLSGPFRQYLKSLRSRPGRTLGRTAVTGTALGLPALAGKDIVANLLGFETRDMTKPSEDVGDMIGKVATELGRAPITTIAGLPFYGKDLLEAQNFTDAMNAILGEGEAYGKFYEGAFGSAPPEFGFIEREATPLEDQMEDKPLGRTIEDIRTDADERQREQLQAAMQMYQELIKGDDNTNKLSTLGDAAIAAGAALMEGEGYGGAATAFNEPLAQARAEQAAIDREARGAAAQLAITEDIGRRQADEAIYAELAASGQFDTAEEIDNVLLARRVGVTQRVPEDDKGEIDQDKLDSAGPGVYVDPKTRFNALFLAVNKDNQLQKFNSVEEARDYAKS